MSYPPAAPIRLDEDWHVHSTFSDGKDTMERDVEVAGERGLRLLCLVDHVRAETDWVGDFVAEARRVGDEASLAVLCGVETKMLDTLGELDLPRDFGLADRLLIADHQLPTPTGPMDPGEARGLIEQGDLAAGTAVRWLVEASSNALEAHPGAILAHSLSILPKLGLAPSAFTAEHEERLVAALQASGGCLEISERWRCPGVSLARRAIAAAVPVVASTDSHKATDIGLYDYCGEVVAALERDSARAGGGAPD